MGNFASKGFYLSFIVFLFLALWCSGCGGSANLVRSDSLHGDAPTHRLQGRIYSVKDRAFLSEAQLLEAMAGADHVIVGESHDNPSHQDTELQLARMIWAQGDMHILVMEMLSSDQQTSLDKAGGLKGEELRVSIGWNERGWDWHAYGPVIEEALGRGIPVFAGNFSRSEVMGRMKRAAETREVERLGTRQQESVLKVLDESHCGLVPRERLRPMLHLQVARDVQMQRAMMAGSCKGTTLLIAGRFHARLDVGVPLHIKAEAPEAVVLSVGLLPVREGIFEPAQYMVGNGGEGAHDIIIFTAPTAARPDPCEDMRRLYKERARSKP